MLEEGFFAATHWVLRRSERDWERYLSGTKGSTR